MCCGYRVLAMLVYDPLPNSRSHILLGYYDLLKPEVYVDICQVMDEGGDEEGTNPVGFVASISRRLIELLSHIVCRLLR